MRHGPTASGRFPEGTGHGGKRLGSTSAVAAKQMLACVGCMTEKGRSATVDDEPSPARSGHRASAPRAVFHLNADDRSSVCATPRREQPPSSPWHVVAPFRSDVDPRRVHRGSSRERTRVLCRCITSSSTWLTATAIGPSRSCTRRGGWSTARSTIATPSLPAISRWSSSRSHASSSVASRSRPRLSIQCPRIPPPPVLR